MKGQSCDEYTAGEATAGKVTALRTMMVLALAIEAGLIHLMSRHGDFLQEGEAWKFAAFGGVAGIAYWVAAACATRIKISMRQSTCAFWLAAVVLRVTILPIVPGDDLWRYRWEGMIQLHGFNPYQSSPASPELIGLRNADWPMINQRNYPAIYPPLSEAIFAGIAALGNSVWLYKGLFALADLASIAVLRRLLVQSGVAAQEAVWYAWNPLVVYAFAGAAHFDSLMILALLGAIWAMQKTTDASARRHVVAGVALEIPWFCWLSALFLGLSIAIKVAPVILLPLWGFALRSWRRVAVLLPLALAPLLIGAFTYGFPKVPVFSTLREFGAGFRVNDPVWWLFDGTGWMARTGNNFLPGVCALAICAALTFRFRHDWQRGSLWGWGAMLLLSPVVHAWYVVWVLPLAVWRGKTARAWCVFSISTFGYFLLWEVNHASGKPWEEPLWLRSVILMPPLCYLGWTELRRRQSELVATSQTH